MATFSESQITDLAEILGTNSDYLSQWLTTYADVLTDSDKTAVLLRVTAYKAIEDDNVHVSAGPAGFQGAISPVAKRAGIKKRIADLLHWQTSSGSGLVRG